MKRRHFQLLSSILIGLVMLPIAWYIVYERPLSERPLWFVGVVIFGLLFNIVVYRPIAKRLEDN